MSDMIAEAATRLFAAHARGGLCTGPGGGADWRALWRDIEAAGFPLALLPEAQGGFGLAPAAALDLVRIGGAMAAPVPLAETLLANRMLAAAGLPLATGPASIATGLSARREAGGWRLTGKAQRVPWGREAATLAVLATDRDGTGLLLRAEGGWQADAGRNLADEPRDALRFDLWLPPETAVPAPLTAEMLLACGAAMRAQAMAGAMEAALALSVDYANMRAQFGRPIGRFQAIQQSLAVMAGHAAAARAGAAMAATALPAGTEGWERFANLAAAAKLRAGEAAGAVAAIAHQVHGAIGFTGEYRLHPLTRRLWAWRDEFGSESHWADRLGQAVAEGGPEGLWPFLTAPTETAA